MIYLIYLIIQCGNIYFLLGCVVFFMVLIVFFFLNVGACSNQIVFQCSMIGGFMWGRFGSFFTCILHVSLRPHSVQG